MARINSARRWANGAGALAIALSGVWPGAGGAQTPNAGAVTTVAPLNIQAPSRVPQVGTNASDLRGCASSTDIYSLNQGLTVDDETGLLVQAEAAYRIAYDTWEHSTPEGKDGTKARLDEAERYLADIQDVMRRGPGTPVRAIVEARKAERNADDGVDGIYTPSEYKDLRLSNIVASRQVVKGASVLHITGKIYNTRHAAITIPPLWFAALGSQGETLKTQQSVATRQVKIAPGRSVPFVFDLPAPGEAQKAAVTFAPRDRLPRVESYEAGCGSSLDIRSGGGGGGRGGGGGGGGGGRGLR